MIELPKGWVETTLGTLGHYWNGRAFKKSEWRPEGHGRQIIRIQDLTGSHQAPNYFDGVADHRNVVCAGDILVSWAATLGVFEWRGPEAVVNQHIFKVESLIDRRFHRHLLESVLADLRHRSHGSGMVHVTRNVFDETRVLLPPLAEQERIAEAIEEQFSRLDEGERLLRSVRRRLDPLTTAFIDAATADYPRKPLGELIREPLRNGHSAKRSIIGSVPVFTLTAVTMNDFSERNTKLTGADPRRVADLWAEPGDIFVERSNTPDLVGTAALYRGPAGRAIFPDLMIRVRVGSALIPEYAELGLRSPQMRRYFQRAAKGIASSMPKIDQGSILAAEMPIPPIADQVRLVQEVGRQLSISEATTTTVDKAIMRSQQLRRSIFERAFSGQLVPQEPSDEPASALLARIATEPTNATKSRGRQPK